MNRDDTIWITAVVAAMCMIFAGLAMDGGHRHLALALVIVSMSSAVASVLAFFFSKD